MQKILEFVTFDVL